jgi:hypothetical protein
MDRSERHTSRSKATGDGHRAAARAFGPGPGAVVLGGTGALIPGSQRGPRCLGGAHPRDDADPRLPERAGGIVEEGCGLAEDTESVADLAAGIEDARVRPPELAHEVPRWSPAVQDGDAEEPVPVAVALGGPGQAGCFDPALPAPAAQMFTTGGVPTSSDRSSSNVRKSKAGRSRASVGRSGAAVAFLAGTGGEERSASTWSAGSEPQLAVRVGRIAASEATRRRRDGDDREAGVLISYVA